MVPAGRRRDGNVPGSGRFQGCVGPAPTPPPPRLRRARARHTGPEHREAARNEPTLGAIGGRLGRLEREVRCGDGSAPWHWSEAPPWSCWNSPHRARSHRSSRPSDSSECCGAYRGGRVERRRPGRAPAWSDGRGSCMLSDRPTPRLARGPGGAGPLHPPRLRADPAHGPRPDRPGGLVPTGSRRTGCSGTPSGCCSRYARLAG
jgi:hypothetical protein